MRLHDAFGTRRSAGTIDDVEIIGPRHSDRRFQLRVFNCKLIPILRGGLGEADCNNPFGTLAPYEVEPNAIRTTGKAIGNSDSHNGGLGGISVD